MTFLVRETSGLTDIGAIAVRESAGLSQIGEVWVRTTSGLQQVFGQFSLMGNTGFVSGTTSSHSSVRITTRTVTVSPKPSGPVDTVAWSFSDMDWTATTPNGLTTAFRSPLISPGESANTTATCTVTRGAATASFDVDAYAYNLGS